MSARSATITGTQPRDLFIVANDVETLGGVQRLAHNLAIMLIERGHRVTVVGIDHAEEPHDYGRRPYRCVTLNHRRFQRSGLLGLRRVTKQRRWDVAHRAAVGRLSALFREAQEGIVIVLQVYSMNWVEPADRAHLQVIGMSHESFDGSVNSGRYKRIKRFYPDVDLFLLLTHADARRFEVNGFNNVGVMHNPLSFYPDTGSDLKSKVVIATGRYDPQKAYDRLIDAFSTIAPDHPDWTLKIFGSGPLRGTLREQVEQLGLKEQVKLPGLAKDVQTELLRSSVFALSSIYEGLPIALGEAMACGLPSVAFDCAPGVREMLTDGEDGIVVPPLDTTALARGLRLLIEDEGLRRRLGRQARVSARKFAPEEIVDQWEEVFEAVQR